jgi:gliding motility-associated-like protein
VTYSGFINGDTKANLTTQPTVTTTAVPGSAAGPYPITVSGAVDPNYTITYVPGTLTVALSGDNNLSGIHLADPYAALTTTTGTGAVNYKASVSNTATTITETATSADPAATIKINSQAATAGSASASIALSVGANMITTVVTAQNGSTKTYIITVTRAPSSNAYLSSLKLENPYAALTASTGAGYKNYTASVTNATTSVKILAVTADPTATITFNGNVETSGNPFPATLLVGANTLNVVVTAADGTNKDYIITVTRAKSSNANLSSIELAHPYAALTAVAGPDDGDYTATVSSTTATIDEVAKTADATAMITINGTTVASGDDSAPIPLAEGNTTITTVVTAQDGSTKKTYVITVTRPMALAHIADGMDSFYSVNAANGLRLNGDGVMVHQGVSPNGDGINDFLKIDGITNYPDNKLLIMNRDGLLVYEAKGYDNSTRVFDGHSNKNGQMQLPGTYFFLLDYIVKGVTQHKIGYIVLKY